MTAAKSAKLKIVKSLYLKAPPRHVWKFLTTGPGLSKWFHDAPHDLEQGGEWRLNTNSMGREGEKMAWGKVVEMKPHEKLVHTFTHPGLKGVETTCTWTLEPVEDGTWLTLVHDGFAGFAEALDHDLGWEKHFPRLRLVVA
jgi:uncharacterized protein YndB with AHSA1/START domain